MADGEKINAQSRFIGGIAPFDKEGTVDQFAFGRSLDYRSDPRVVKLLPRTAKESGSLITALPKWAEQIDTDTYIYDEGGSLYKRTSAGVYSYLHTAPASSGNGLGYYGEDDFLYYPTDTAIGRYGRVSGTATFVDDFLRAEGGVPLNTAALDLEASSSQYASRADTASLSITGDLSIEATIKPESLPAAGASMTLVSKWDENTNLRSYKFDLYGVSGYFGTGGDGALTVSSNTTEAPVDSACSGTSGTYSLTATNVGFAAGQEILIHQTQGTGAGTWQRNTIVAYTAGTITLEDALNYNYTTGAQVRVLPQYTNVTVNTGITYTAKAWNGTVGGILAFIASGTITVTGTITASGKGFRGGSSNANGSGTQGEGTGGAGSQGTTANGNGGGGGEGTSSQSECGGGGGGGNGAVGTDGVSGESAPIMSGGTGGETGGNADLTTMVFGGGGGAGGDDSFTSGANGGSGGTGGGIICLMGVTATISGAVTAAGTNGSDASGASSGGGGGGAGGSVLIKAQTATLGAALITAAAGTGGVGLSTHGTGGTGAVGRIHLDYYTSYTGTTTPTLDVIYDISLVTTATYHLRLSVSTDGTAVETLSRPSTVVAGSWSHVAVTWDASAATAVFYQDGASLGSMVGAATSAHDNASKFAVGCDFNNAAQNFFDGVIDEVRLFNDIRTASEILVNRSQEIAVTTPNLQAYFQFDGTADDSTSNANNLTATGSPVYTASVPWASPTTRLDLDQELNTSGQTYTLATTISETAANRQTFVPAKDPQKSVEVLIAAKGTGNWTLTVHDGLNRTIASKTIANGDLAAGDNEFIFSSVWTPVIGASYHFHVTSTVADGTVTTTTLNDLETVDFHTYYQFLVSDTFHPAINFLNFMAFGNGRYLATWDAASYNPHRLTLPPGWRVRSLALWNEYLAIGCIKGSTVYERDQGMIFFWDGYSTRYNFYLPVPEGSVNAMLGSRGLLYFVAGYQGDLMAYGGGAAATKLRRLPKIADDKYIEIMPGALTMWRGLLRLGVGVTDSTSIEQGVYTWGHTYENQPESFSYDYPVSTGTRTGADLKIGFVLPVNKELLIGWQDNTASGVDVVDPAGSPYATGTIEKLMEDEGGVWKEKAAQLVRADFKPLRTGESVRVKYKLDRADNWTTGAIVSTAGETKARLNIDAGRHREIAYAADLYTTTTTSPELLELSLKENILASEEDV